MHLTADRLQAIVGDIFMAADTPAEAAAEVARSLVESNLMGHDSHGVLRVGAYLDAIARGELVPSGQLTVVRESASTALLDGGHGYGQVIARQAMERAIAKARAHDVGWVAIRNCGHTGRLGAYAVQAAEAGLIGMVFGSGCAKGGLVAPYLGTSRVLNTNPLAWGLPAGQHPPVFLDYATSMCAQGKIQAAVDKGVRVSEGWLLDAAGQPSTDPNDLARGGALLPFGLHKGYCLGFLIELLTGGLAGTSCAILPDYTRDYPTVMLALNIEAFQPLETFRQMVDDLVAATKAARKAPGVEEILVPGEPEWHTRAQRLAHGLDLPEATWQRLVAAATRLGLRIDERSAGVG